MEVCENCSKELEEVYYVCADCRKPLCSICHSNYGGMCEECSKDYE